MHNKRHTFLLLSLACTTLLILASTCSSVCSRAAALEATSSVKDTYSAPEEKAALWRDCRAASLEKMGKEC